MPPRSFRGGGRGGGAGPSPTKLKGMFMKGVWHCDCNPRLPSVHFQVKKQGPNHGKWFYSCQKGKDDTDRCKFFLWDADAKQREQGALQNNSRTEPQVDHFNTTPSRPPRSSTPPSFFKPTESSRKRNRPIVEEDEDEFGIDQGDSGFDDELRHLANVETPKKVARTESHMTPRRRIPWESATGMATPSTTTPFQVKVEDDSSQTMSHGSTFNTPTPSRFKDMGTAQSDSLVRHVFNLLDEEDERIGSTTATALKALLEKHERRAEGNNKSKEVLRLRIKAEEAKGLELTHRNNTLQAELEAAKATIDHLKWEKEHAYDT